MTGSRFRAFCLVFLLILSAPAPAPAQSPADEAAIRTTVSRWYEELAKKEDGRYWMLTAPGFIDASPHYRHVNNGSRKLGPRHYTSLSATALKFAWEILSVRADSSFARVQVWERGYFYAAAAQKTYELAASTTFLLERREKDGAWLILAHQSSGQGIPPDRITSPMPDLRALYYATQGKNRDAEADARAAAASRF